MGYTSGTNALAYENGAYIIITNQTTLPSSTEGISVAAGTMTNVQLAKKFSNRLPTPYSECRDDLKSPSAFDSFFYKKTFESGYAYKQKDCLNLCVQDYLIRMCGCADSAYPSLYNVSYCSSVNGVKCIFDKQKELYASHANDKFVDYCPLECSSQDFSVTVSASDFPSTELGSMFMGDQKTQDRLGFLSKPLSLENIKSGYLWLNVYYDETKYTLVEENPAQMPIDLMSSIGGTMGLYIGVSFLSFAEIVEALFVTILISFGCLFRSVTTRKRNNNIGATKA